MIKKYKRNLKKILSCILVLGIILGSIGIVNFPNVKAELSFDDVNYGQMFSKTYMYEGEKKTVYVYNTNNGKVRITGDIVVTVGALDITNGITQSKAYIYECKHLDNYIELSIGNVTNINMIAYDGDYGYYNLLLTTRNGYIYSFNEENSFYSETNRGALIYEYGRITNVLGYTYSICDVKDFIVLEENITKAKDFDENKMQFTGNVTEDSTVYDYSAVIKVIYTDNSVEYFKLNNGNNEKIETVSISERTDDTIKIEAKDLNISKIHIKSSENESDTSDFKILRYDTDVIVFYYTKENINIEVVVAKAGGYAYIKSHLGVDIDNEGIYIKNGDKRYDIFFDDVYKYLVNDYCLNDVRECISSYNNKCIKYILSGIDPINLTNLNGLEVVNSVENVVKVNSDGLYLTKDGQVYDENNRLLYENVDNLYDNMILQNSKYIMLDNQEEFKLDYASDKNIKLTQTDISNTSITYSFTYDENDITSILAPDNTLIKNNGVYTFYENGCYTFRVVNKYGNEFNKNILVTHISKANLDSPIVSIADNRVTLETNDNTLKIKISKNNAIWSDYTGTIIYSEPFYYKVVKNLETSDTYKISVKNGKADIVNVTQNAIKSNNFAGYGYLLENKAYDLNNNPLSDDIIYKFVAYNNNKKYTHTYSDNKVESYTKVFVSDEDIKKKLGISNIVDTFFDGIYTYILDDNGNLVKGEEGNSRVVGNTVSDVDSWKESILNDNIIDISSLGEITYADNTTYNICENKALGIKLEELKYYTYTNNTLKEINPTIIAARVIENGYASMDNEGNVYIYYSKGDTTYNITDEKGAMVSNGIKLYETGYYSDYSILNTNWTNQINTIEIKQSNNSIDNSFNYDTYNSYEGNEYIESPYYELQIPINITENNTEITFSIFTTNNLTTDNCLALWDVPYIYEAGTNNEISINKLIKNGVEVNMAWEDVEIKYTLNKGNYYMVMKNSRIKDLYTTSSNGITENKSFIEDVKNIYIPYKVLDSNNNEVNVIYNNGKYIFEVNKNDTYTINTYKFNSLIDGTKEKVKTETIKITNIDTVNPSVVINEIGTYGVKFSGVDNPGIGEDAYSAVSGIKNTYYSFDNITYDECKKTILYNENINGNIVSDNNIITSNKFIYVYTVDNAGNKSDISKIDISDIEIPEKPIESTTTNPSIENEKETLIKPEEETTTIDLIDEPISTIVIEEDTDKVNTNDTTNVTVYILLGIAAIGGVFVSKRSIKKN